MNIDHSSLNTQNRFHSAALKFSELQVGDLRLAQVKLLIHSTIYLEIGQADQFDVVVRGRDLPCKKLYDFEARIGQVLKFLITELRPGPQSRAFGLPLEVHEWMTQQDRFNIVGTTVPALVIQKDQVSMSFRLANNEIARVHNNDLKDTEFSDWMRIYFIGSVLNVRVLKYNFEKEQFCVMPVRD